MKILVINPNSDAAMTRAIAKTARGFAAGGFEVECLSSPTGPKFIETTEDEMLAAPGMAALVRKHEPSSAAFVVACHCDPNLDLLKEITAKPVVGIGEASMRLATMLGHKFSVLSATRHSVPNKEALVRKYGLESSLASIRVVERGDFFRAARAAIEKDGAEVIVLGCAGMTGLDGRLSSKLGVPVLDGVVCGLIIASGLARYGTGTSKAGRYRPG